MRIGTMRRRIEIQKHTFITDDFGGRVEGWVTDFKVWASVESVSGKEFFAGASTQSESTWKITARYIPDLETVKYRVFYDGRYFNITAILPDARERTMTMICSRIFDVSHEEIVHFVDEMGIHRIMHTVAPESTLVPAGIKLS